MAQKATDPGAGRSPLFLVGWTEIGRTFGLGWRKAKGWYDAGAPILLLDEKPVAEAGELWEWLKAEYG